ncbi:hypothetical protein, partial [Endozoicomonas sp. YOMI1]|uniref:hypothetical protein n=1 Tax=Endozoicomonas sp. YOMI1 TaxID=2828739 RepID=UPI00214879AA
RHDRLPKVSTSSEVTDSGHIEQGKLSPELYPEANKTEITKERFYNINSRLNLGANNSTFPLISLMNGLTRMVTAILMRSGSVSNNSGNTVE